MRLLTLGPKGTHSHQAATIAAQRLGEQYGEFDIRFVERNADVFISAAHVQCCGAAPIETATGGLVQQAFGGYWLHQTHTPIQVIGEVELDIKQHLMGHPSRPTTSRTQPIVCSHEEALKQCLKKLEESKIPRRCWEVTASTAEAAKKVSEVGHEQNILAIASEFAAKEYGLEIVQRNMHDSDTNATRFHILGPERPKPTGRDKTAVLFRVEHKPGRLYHAMGAIVADNVNISSQHSIPLGRFDKFAFYIEFDEHADTQVGHNILKRLETYVEHMIVLGSYPQCSLTQANGGGK